VSLSLLIAEAGFGCSVNPVSGLPEVTLVSKETEKEIGREEAKRIEQQVGLLKDAALTDYLNRLGQRLAEQSPRRDVTYQFLVADTPEPNAFALPGGYVYVTRGLLALVNSEDELTGVVGHEIGHVAARHSVQKISKQGPFAALTNVVAGVTGLVVPLAGRIVGGIGELATGLVFSPYSREQEREADRVGQEIAAKAGWDPAALSTFLHTLEREEELRLMGRRHGSFFDSHPATPERVTQTAEHAKGLHRGSRNPLSRSRDEFLKRLEGLVVGSPAAHGVFQEQRFLHPDLSFTLQFPAKWKVSNSPQQVAALAPNGEAAVILQAVAEGNDPLEGVRRLEKDSGTTMAPKTRRFFINGLPAASLQVQAETRQGTLAVDFTWIAYAGLIYQLTSLAPFESLKTLQPIFDEAAQSFRPLTPAERSKITEKHLRLVTARAAETIEALATRTGSNWPAKEIAVANGLETDVGLQEGQLIKIAVAERYLPQ
jgi:predicted Zn-dependent protease